MQVQNKLQLAEPRLPQVVQQQGIQVAKATKNFLVVVGFVSTDNSMNSADLGDFIASTVQDPISRTNGVGDYQLFGAQYAMRIWLDPAKLDNFALTPSDVSAAIQAQNVQVAAGELGGLPAVPNQQLDATIIGPSYLHTPEQFGDILLKVEPNGAKVLLRDVARIELGGENYSFETKYNGHPAAAVAVKLASGANALDTVKAVRATIEQLRPNFPPGVEPIYPYDTTPFVELSIHDVAVTLLDRGRAGVRDHVPVLAESAGDADPDHCGAGRAAWDLRDPRVGWVLDQQPDDVRHGPRHRPAGG